MVESRFKAAERNSELSTLKYLKARESAKLSAEATIERKSFEIRALVTT